MEITINCVYFISGHTDLSIKEFNSIYVPLIDKEIEKGSKFVVGDAPGVDIMAIEYLYNKGVNNVVIYHIGDSPRLGELADKITYSHIGGFTSHKAKDTAMTLASGHDIAYSRTLEQQKALYGEKYRHRLSGTEQNIRRRGNKKCPNCQ